MSVDNTVMPISTTFTLRSKDVSAAGDGSLAAAMMLARAYPLDWSLNGVSGGMFARASKSGSMAAGLAANAPVYAFQWPSSTLLAAVRRVKIGAFTLGTGFTAGLATFDMFVARAFTAQDTGGAAVGPSGNNAKLRTSMNASAAKIQIATTGALTAGTRTLDDETIETRNMAAPASAFTSFLSQPPFILFEKLQGEHPLLLAQNEGFEIQATVPATGVWQFAVTVEWDELPLPTY